MIYRCCRIKLKTVIKVIVRLVDKHKYNLKKWQNRSVKNKIFTVARYNDDYYVFNSPHVDNVDVRK